MNSAKLPCASIVVRAGTDTVAVDIFSFYGLWFARSGNEAAIGKDSDEAVKRVTGKVARDPIQVAADRGLRLHVSDNDHGNVSILSYGPEGFTDLGLEYATKQDAVSAIASRHRRDSCGNRKTLHWSKWVS